MLLLLCCGPVGTAVRGSNPRAAPEVHVPEAAARKVPR